MNSFDMFDTLVARRCVRPFVFGNPTDPNAWQLEREAREMIPIAQNIARVKPGDVIVSDMYLPKQFLQEQLARVTGLTNEIYVSPEGKASGIVWKTIRPELHLGDNIHTDIESPQAAGIEAELTTVAKMTDREQQIEDAGFPGLARLMREARLATCHGDDPMRQLQLFQIQSNLPFLFFGSILLHRRLDGFDRVLMSSRDCWLWLQLFKALQPALGGKYDIVYFYTSRLTRYWPSKNYRKYVDDLLEVKSLIVDLCGFGNSLKSLVPDAQIVLLTGYENCVVESMIQGWLDEASNFARHPMICDVDKDGEPKYANPTGVDWAEIPEVWIMHEAFLKAVQCVPEHDFSIDLKQDSEIVRGMLHDTLYKFFDCPALQRLANFRIKEAVMTDGMVASRGPRPEGLIV